MRFSMVGSELVNARHTNVLTLLGMFNLHRLAQNFLISSELEPKASSLSSIPHNRWYPAITEYMPSLDFGQFRISFCEVKHTGMDFIN